jgi:hypothetical protein
MGTSLIALEQKQKNTFKKNKSPFSKLSIEQKKDICSTLRKMIQKLDKLDNKFEQLSQEIFNLKSQTHKKYKKYAA